ncbi:arylsulfatase [Phycisphaeraceae bacterium D3-23]
MPFRDAAPLFILLILALPACAQTATQAEPTAAPNIVLILADDLGFGDPTCYNANSKIPTPHIDALAGQGMRFTDAHSPSSVCTPTRYAILTGRYCWRTELKSSVLWPWDRPLLEDDRTTLPELLRERGYATTCIGKWHLGWTWLDEAGELVNTRPSPSRLNNNQRNAIGQRIDFTQPIQDGPLAHGFDTYFGDDVPNFPPYTFIEDDHVVALPTQEKPDNMFGHAGPMSPGWTLSEVMPAITERTVDYIASRSEPEHQDEPFFLFMTLTAPHTPIVPGGQYTGLSEAGRYGDFVAQVDASVGAVMQALEEAGLGDNTLVIFTSDNGSPARSGANDSGPVGSVITQYGHRVSGPWRGLKSDAWEGGHRVPMIVRWPGEVAPGTVNSQPVCLVDWYATVAQRHGIELAADQAEDSFTLLATLRGENDIPPRDHLIHHSGNGTFAIRQGGWKLIVGNLGSGGFSRPGRVAPNPGGPQGQLYHLADDPGETTNVWMDHPEIVDELTARLESYRTAGRSR